jgi:hypothetical protein
MVILAIHYYLNNTSDVGFLRVGNGFLGHPSGRRLTVWSVTGNSVSTVGLLSFHPVNQGPWAGRSVHSFRKFTG